MPIRQLTERLDNAFTDFGHSLNSLSTRVSSGEWPAGGEEDLQQITEAFAETYAAWTALRSTFTPLAHTANPRGGS